MRKALPYMGAALAALAMAWSTPARAQGEFKDLDPRHWAYEAVTELQTKEILKGYPNGFFSGKRTLTRYEFAIALKRALDWVQANVKGTAGPAGEKGEKGDKGDPGEKGDKGDAGITPEELANLKRLTDEFRNELTSLGANVRDINNRLDALSKEVAAINERLDKMLKLSGGLFLGVRTDRSRGIYVDRGGAFRTASNGLTTPDIVHDLHLKATANLPEGVTFTGDIAFSNYLSYRGGTLNQGNFALRSIAGGAATLGEQITPIQAQVDIPIGGIGRDSTLTLGRYKHKGSELTYTRPDLDPYFYVPDYDDNAYIQDGFRFSSRFGSLNTTLFGAHYGTPTLSAVTPGGFLAFNRPVIGSGPIGPGANALVGKPFGINALGANAAANAGVGIRLGLPLFNIGQLGVGATYYSTGVGRTAAIPFSGVTVYEAQLKINPFGRFNVSAEAAKSVTSAGFDTPDGQPNEDNNAYKLRVGWASGPVDINAGYQYIDPRYAAPGYWLRIGNWFNPTNVRGPFVHVGYKFSDALQVNFGGDLLEGARNRPGYFRIADNVNRAYAGVNYRFNKTWSAMVNYEGVFYELSGATTGLATSTEPIEQYLTIGANLNLAGNTTLRLAYQMINFQNLGGGFGAGTGIAGVGGGGNSYNAGVFTTQLAVRF